MIFITFLFQLEILTEYHSAKGHNFMSCPGVTVAVPRDNQCLQIYGFLFRNRYRILSLSAVVVAKESTLETALSEEERNNYHDLDSEDRQYMGPSSILPLYR